MEFFERVCHLAELKGLNQTKLAEKLGQSQGTFNKWLNIKSQRNLWARLPELVEIFPDVRLEWLVSEQEPIFRDADSFEPDQVRNLIREKEQLEKELAREREIISKMAGKLVGMTDQPIIAVGQE